MIDIYSKHDNMHKNIIFYDLICINYHMISCINCTLSRDIADITRVKAYLNQHLIIWDLGTPKYFLGIVFVYRSGKLVLNQRNMS